MNRSFAEIARRALCRASFHVSPVKWNEYVARARLRDARTALGPHAGSTRAADRRMALRSNATVSLARGLVTALSPRKAA